MNHFHGFLLPEPSQLAGYAALVDKFQLKVPLPSRLAAIGTRHHPNSNEQWQLLTPRHAPPDTLAGHLEFALQWEGVDLAILKALFQTIPAKRVTGVIRSKPTGAYARRIWFLYEWLLGKELSIPDPGKVRAVPVIDATLQFALERGTPSPRHKTIDNLPGIPAFCPLIRRTPALVRYASEGFDRMAAGIVARTHADVMNRAAAFLLLSDSKSSFEIEGERPTAQRADRWARAIAQAGTHTLSVPELERLQRIVIGDSRFVKLGLRDEGGFIGTHDRKTSEPIPDHISARAGDLQSLVDGIVAYDARAIQGGMDPVAAAAAIAFGFVYIHPFVDGNGRLHRWLIHHVLAAAGYNPPGLVFPVSAAILREIDGYRKVLESYSRPLLELIDWVPTRGGNVEVKNQTADYYRYFDATRHADFLYCAVQQTVERDLPEEVAYLEAFDRFADGVQTIADMPDRLIELLHRFLRQGGGKLSKRARKAEFAAFSDDEVKRVEALYLECFNPAKKEYGGTDAAVRI